MTIEEPKYTLQEARELVDDLATEINALLDVAASDLDVKLMIEDKGGDVHFMTDEERRELAIEIAERLPFSEFIIARRPEEPSFVDAFEPPTPDARYWCTPCAADLPISQRDAHLASSSHITKLQDLEDPISINEDRLSGYCEVCDDSFAIDGDEPESNARKRHVNTKKHQVNMPEIMQPDAELKAAMPDELCGIGGCVKLPGHVFEKHDLDHSWEKK